MNIDIQLDMNLTAYATAATHDPTKTVSQGVGIVSGTVETKVFSRPG